MLKRKSSKVNNIGALSLQDDCVTNYYCKIIVSLIRAILVVHNQNLTSSTTDGLRM